jgi:hypothetical protein
MLSMTFPYQPFADQEKDVRKMRSKLSSRTLDLPAAIAERPQLLRILLHSGFGAENRFKEITSNLFDGFVLVDELHAYHP